jgi:mannosyltransferase
VGDVRAVGRRPAPGAVSQVPARQRDESAPAVPPTPEPQAGAGPRRIMAARLWPILVAAAVMLVAGLWGLARDSSMGNDEVATRWAARLSLHQLDHLLRHVDAVHGLYYLLMHGWMAVGTSPAVMRVPSVIAMTAAVAMIVILGRQLTGSAWAGVFAGLITALTPTISYYAQTARSYALVFACVVGATLVLLHALRAEAAGAGGARLARSWLAYGVLITLTGYLNELSLLILAAHLVTVLLARYRWQALARWTVAGAAGALLVVPLAILSAREDRAVAWIARPDAGDLRVLFHDYFGATTVVALLLLVCAVAAVWPGGALTGLGYWRRRPAETDADGPVAGGGISLASVAAPLLVIPAGLLIIESLIAHPLYVDRYVLYGEAGAALLAGAGLYRLGSLLVDAMTDPAQGADGSAARAAGWRPLLWIPGVVVCVLALVLQLGPQHRVRTPESRLFDFGGPSRFVAAHAQPGDGMLFFTAFYRKAELGYPADFRQVTDFAVAVTPTAAGNFQGTDRRAAAVTPLMLDYRRIWVLGQAPSVRLGGAFGAESRVLAMRFTPIARRHYRGIVLTLWQRHPA